MSQGEEILNSLKVHPVLLGAVPDRVPLSYRDTAGMTMAERCAPGIRALSALPSWPQARNLVKALGQLCWVDAVPALAILWKRCPIKPLVTEVGHALFKIGTPQAHAALQSTLEEADHFFAFMGIKSVVVCEGRNAYDRLECYFFESALADPTGMGITRECLRFFSPQAIRDRKPIWNDPSIPLLTLEDPRWIHLALQLRRRKEFKDYARPMLRALPREELEAALRQFSDPPAVVTPPYTGQRNFLARYQRGEHELVWRDLLSIGPILDEGLRVEAQEVAIATMERVRVNVEIITERLQARDYPFTDFMPPRSFPNEATSDEIRRIEAAAGGHVPISLAAFWTVVGGVSWMHFASSEYDDENAQLGNADPLCVNSAAMALDQVANWQRDCEKYRPEAVGPLFLYLAPDHYHKARVSGGAPYGIEIPNEAADALWENEEHDLHFVDYLRLCFQWGGFPRLPIERKILSEDMKKVVEHLEKDIVPF